MLNKFNGQSYVGYFMDNIASCGTHCAYVYKTYIKNQCVQVSEENGARFFEWLSFCPSRHIHELHTQI